LGEVKNEKRGGFTGKCGSCFMKNRVFLMIRDSKAVPTLNRGDYLKTDQDET
jgi:hypothetical protein